jgi:hypothetical protein
VDESFFERPTSRRAGGAMSTLALGRLESVALREVWPHEAKDFTPWLAESENLSLLAETLRLGDLQVQGIYKRVSIS